MYSRAFRFKKFTGEWNSRRLGEIGVAFNGLSSKDKDNFGKGKPYIQYKQIFDSPSIEIDKCGLVEILDTENQNRVKYGDVFFTISSETPYEIGMASVLLAEVDEMYLNSFCFGFRPSSLTTLNPLFASHLFRSTVFRNDLIKLAQGSTRFNMSKTELLKLTVRLPDVKEQIIIAQSLSIIDTKIETEKNVRQKYLSQKQFLLQDLFK